MVLAFVDQHDASITALRRKLGWNISAADASVRLRNNSARASYNISAHLRARIPELNSVDMLLYQRALKIVNLAGPHRNA